MKFDLTEAIGILESTPLILDKQLAGLSKNWLSNNEGESTWTPAQIVCHLIHCEDDDWIPRLKIILNNAGEKKFKPFDRTFGFENADKFTINELLDEFRNKRNENLEYLKSLKLDENDMDKKGIHPDFGEVTLRQLLSTWVVHDLSHIAQINRVMSFQYKDETGPWKKYFPILSKRKL